MGVGDGGDECGGGSRDGGGGGVKVGLQSWTKVLGPGRAFPM